MLPSGIRIWQPEFPTKILSRKTGAVQSTTTLSLRHDRRIYLMRRVFSKDSAEVAAAIIYMLSD